MNATNNNTIFQWINSKRCIGVIRRGHFPFLGFFHCSLSLEAIATELTVYPSFLSGLHKSSLRWLRSTWRHTVIYCSLFWWSWQQKDFADQYFFSVFFLRQKRRGTCKRTTIKPEPFRYRDTDKIKYRENHFKLCTVVYRDSFYFYLSTCQYLPINTLNNHCSETFNACFFALHLKRIWHCSRCTIETFVRFLYPHEEQSMAE